MVVIEEDGYDGLVERVRMDSSFKGAIGRSYMKLIYANKLRNLELRFIICSNAVVTFPVVIYARKNFFLLNKVDEKINYLNAAGLIDYWYFQDVGKQHLTLKVPKQPQVLTIGRLSGCFHILMFGLVASSVCFLSELVAIRLCRAL